jgi:hypothetical protein
MPGVSNQNCLIFDTLKKLLSVSHSKDDTRILDRTVLKPIGENSKRISRTQEGYLKGIILLHVMISMILLL